MYVYPPLSSFFSTNLHTPIVINPHILSLPSLIELQPSPSLVPQWTIVVIVVFIAECVLFITYMYMGRLFVDFPLLEEMDRSMSPRRGGLCFVIYHCCVWLERAESLVILLGWMGWMVGSVVGGWMDGWSLILSADRILICSSSLKILGAYVCATNRLRLVYPFTVPTIQVHTTSSYPSHHPLTIYH